MKRIILYLCLGISILINGELGKYILEREPVCDRVHWSDVDRSKEMVSDAETARRIAEASFRMEKSGWGYQENVDYQIDIYFDDLNYEWVVTYTAVTPEGIPYLDGTRILGVRRDNGVIMGYGSRYEEDNYNSFFK